MGRRNILTRILCGEEVDALFLPCDYVRYFEDGTDAEVTKTSQAVAWLLDFRTQTLFKNTGTANPQINSGDAVLVVYGYSVKEIMERTGHRGKSNIGIVAKLFESLQLIDC